MKTRLSLLASALILLATTVNAQTSNVSQSVPWQTYTVAGEKFSVALPTLPAMELNHALVRTPNKYRVEIRMGAYADGVVYTIYVMENVKPLLSLENFVEREGRSGWSLMGERPLSSDGVFVQGLVYADPAWGMGQYFAVADRLYRFEAVGAPSNDPRMARFFESLSFEKPKDAIAVVDGPGKPYEPAVASEADADIQKVFTGKEVDRKTRVVMKLEPTYTEEARQNSVVGSVVLKCIFASNGSVMNLVTVSGLPFGLTEKAIDATRKIKFIPAMKNGKYVSMWMQLEYNFSLY